MCATHSLQAVYDCSVNVCILGLKYVFSGNVPLVDLTIFCIC